MRGLLLVCVIAFPGCRQDLGHDVSKDLGDLSGPYLGQSPPGMKGELFSPGLVSTGLDELNAVFVPGGEELIFSLHLYGMKFMMVGMREENGRWTKPEILPFSGKYSDVDPALSPDGQRLYFCSNRPRAGTGESERDFDIWYVEKTDSGWSDPWNLGPPVNSDADEFYPSLTKDGTLYFQSRRPGGIGASDIYRAELVDGRYVEAVCLPDTVNSPGFEGDAFVAPDGSYIIVSTVREVENYGSADLYISFRAEDGQWLPLRNMGEAINSEGGENCQVLSPCGRYLFYTSRQYEHPTTSYRSILAAANRPQNGLGDIYWIDAKYIEGLRTQ